MRKVLILVFLLLLIGVGFAKTKVSSNVDSKVFQELEKNEKVKVIVVLKEPSGIMLASASDVKSSVVSSLSKDEFEKKRDFSSFNGFSGEVSEEGLVKLRKNPNVEKIEYDFPVKAFLTESIPLINASLVHNLQIDNNITGKGETICIIDTGVNYTHESLGGCDNETFLDGNCGKILDGYDFVNNDSDPMDDEGHGTHVAGIVAANGSIIGVASGANLISVKVLDDNGSGYISTAISAVDWCVSNATKYNISVISMSLGTGQVYTDYCNNVSIAFTNSINNAIANNISVVVASGNSGNINGISLPACIENATSIGATTKSDVIASYTNRGSILDLLAPGSNIVSTWIDGLTKSSDGTSMATPHIAGAVALLQQFSKEEKSLTLLPSEILDVLNRTGKQIEDANHSNLTFSRVDVWEAILDLTKPVVNLVKPENASVLSSAEVIFNVSIDDYDEFLNCSLFINNIWNETNNLTANGDIFNVTLEEDSYNSSVICYDNLSQSDESELINFRIDLTDPTVNLSSPENGTTKTSLPFRFTFNVTDYGIDNCILIINNVVNETLSSGINLSGTTEFSDIYLADGNYNWSVNCTDNVERTDNSEEWELTMSCSNSWSCDSWGDCQSDDRKTCSSWTDSNNCGQTYTGSNKTSCNYGGDSGDDGSDSSSSSSSSSGSSTTTQTVSSSITMTGDSGDTKKFSFSKDVGLTGMDIKLRDGVSSAMINVKKLDSKPSDVSELDDFVYDYIQIDTTDITSDNIEEVILKFKVEKTWLTNFDENNVRLNRYHNNEWNELGTVKTSDDNDYVYYEAISPGFSVFVVSVKEGRVIGTSETGNNETLNKTKKGLTAFTGFVGKVFPPALAEWVKNVNNYYWIGSCVFVCLLVIGIVYRKKIFNKVGEEEKEFDDDKKKHEKLSKKEKKLKKKEERKDSKRTKVEDKKKKKIEKLKSQLEDLEGKEGIGFFDRVKSKFRRKRGDIGREEPEVGREKESEEKERGIFALMKKKMRGDVGREKVEKVLMDSTLLEKKSKKSKKKEKPIEKEEVVKEEVKEKKGFFRGIKDKINGYKQRKQERISQFEFRDIKK